jgi:transposase
MALSVDLRKRLLEAYKNGEGSIRRLAKRFSVGPASVWRLLKSYQETGEIKAHPPPGRPPMVGEKELKIVEELARKDKDATLKELSKKFEEKTDIKVSYVTIHNAFKKLNITYKKNAYLI